MTQSQSQDSIVFLTLALGLAVVLVRAARIGALNPAALSQRLGPVTFDFSKSWASAFTVVGAVLGSILSAKGLLPDKPHFLPTASYGALNLLFGVAIVLAGFFYRATSVAEDTTAPGGSKEVQYQGFVWSFLLASAITLWAVIGELATIFLLFGEMAAQASFAEPVLWLFALLMGAGALLVLLYVWRSIKWTIAAQTNQPVQTKSVASQLGVAPLAPPPGGNPPMAPIHLF